MPGIATGETFSFNEGKLYLYASASGTTSGSGIGFARGATLTFTYGWLEVGNAAGDYLSVITGKRAALSIDNLLGDANLFNLANSTGAINARFEALVTGAAGAVNKSAYWSLYSGAVETVSFTQSDNELMAGSYSMYARQWSAWG